jgi:hypothetical protein
MALLAPAALPSPVFLLCSDPRVLPSCRVTNGSNRTVRLQDIQLKYWFDGPMDYVSQLLGSPGAGALGANEFNMVCSDISSEIGGGLSTTNTNAPPSYRLPALAHVLPRSLPGRCITALSCGALSGSFAAGLPGVRGARYVLTLSFAAGSGLLLPSNATMATAAAQEVCMHGVA